MYNINNNNNNNFKKIILLKISPLYTLLSFLGGIL